MAQMQKKTFLKSSEGSTVNFNYQDFAEGTGVTVFNCANAKTSAGNNYIMTTQSPYSSVISTTGTSFDNTFSLSAFNLPKVIKGTAYFSAGVWNQSLGGNTVIEVKVQKLSGATTTDCSVWTKSQTINGNDVSEAVLIPVSLTQTNFKKGDILKLRVSGSAALNNFEIGHDPVNRDATNYAVSTDKIPTKMQLYMPFMIDR